jgi:hypothetical protein
MDKHGLPLTHKNVCKMVNLLFNQKESESIGLNWVTCFIKRRNELASKYT